MPKLAFNWQILSGEMYDSFAGWLIGRLTFEREGQFR